MTAVLGIDPGTARVGLAAGDSRLGLATPVGVIQRRHGDRFWADLAREISARGARRVVVGLPRRTDGSEGDAARMARSLAAEVGRRTGLPVELWDEWFTTVEAERSLVAQGVRRQRRRETVDAVAASLMLQGWLDAHRSTDGSGCPG